MERFLNHEVPSHMGVIEDLELATIVAIVLLLLFLTICFEEIKHYVEHHIPDSLEKVVDRLFGELMVLGFLSIVTFILAELKVFTSISVHLFGEEEKSEVTEYFEMVHYSIFVLMTIFCIKVVELVIFAQDHHKVWLLMEKCVHEKRHGGDMTPEMMNELKRGTGLRRYSSISRWFGKNTRDKPELNQFLYEGLRHEFILERSVEFPFDPAPVESRVDEDFNFASYLIRCNTNILEHIIDIQPRALMFIAFSVVCYYLFARLVGGSMLIMAWTWVFFGFFVLGFNYYFEWYLVNLRDQFLPAKILQLWKNDHARERNLASSFHHMSAEDLLSVLSDEGDSADRGESTRLLDREDSFDHLSFLTNNSIAHLSFSSNNLNPGHLPGWCNVDLDEVRCSRFNEWLVGGIPDRQQSLFWFSHKGPDFFIFLLQIQLLFIGIFVGFVLLNFAPFIYHTSGVKMTALYLVLALGPLYHVDRNNKPLVSVLSQINCIGNLRKPHIVSDVILEEKSANAVRVFLVLYKIRKFAEQQACRPTSRRSVLASDVHVMMSEQNSRSFSNLELHQVGKTFDAIDSDGSGEIDREEMRQVLLRMGANIPPSGIDRLFALLDRDGSGTIERDEFIAWYADHLESDKHISPKERAEELFNSFDLNHSGEITIGMFKHKMDSFKFGFTIDEIGAIANELDRDRSGTICLGEFQRMLEKYQPSDENGSASNGH